MKAFLFISALILSLSTSIAFADTSVTPPTPAVPIQPAAPALSAPAVKLTKAAAKAELQKTSDLLKASTGLTYTAKVSLSTPMSTAATTTPAPTVYDNTVTAEKSGKLSLVISPVGTGQQQMVIDGINLYVYDSAMGKYSKMPAAPGIDGNILGIMRSEESLYSAHPEMLMTTQEMLAFVMMYTSGEIVLKDLPTGATSTITTALSTLDGKQVNVIKQTYKMPQISLSIGFSIDPSTNLPVGFDEEASTAAGKQILSLQETFSSFQLLTAPADATAYAFTPPTGAELVAAAPMPSAGGSQQSALLKSGAKAPNFTVTAANGSKVSLAQFRGKVVVIDFWATWCGPCQASLPHTNMIAKQFRGKPVVFLPICSWDDLANFKTWQKSRANWAMAFYFDPAGQNEGGSIASKHYGVDGIPTQYVIGKDGTVKFNTVGYDESGDPSETALTKAIDSAL